MLPNSDYLLEKTEIKLPLIGFYDAPDPKEFEPVVEPGRKGHACVFAFYKQWLQGKTLQLSKVNFGCGGASHHLFNEPTRSHDDFVKFLVDDEGLKANHRLMDQWIRITKPYKPKNQFLFIGPLKDNLYRYLKTITFLVNPDQLSMLMTGAQYYTEMDDLPPVIAPFGSGCMLISSSFMDLYRSQAVIGATDLAMRKYLPPDIMAFTTTKPMYENLCKIDKNSFFEKGFIRDLKKVRKLNYI